MEWITTALLILSGGLHAVDSQDGAYYIEDIESVIQTTERTGTIISHKGFPSQPYGRRISASLRIIGLKPNVVGTVLFVKFSTTFDVSTSDTRKDCQGPADDILYIGDESSPRAYSRYCNNERPALGMWIPHAVNSDRFIFQLVLSTSLPPTTRAVGFHLEYVAAPLECDITQYNTHSIVGLPSANDEGWFTVRCPQARTGQIRCVNSTWQITCDASMDFSSCCFNESSPGFQTPPGKSNKAKAEITGGVVGGGVALIVIIIAIVIAVVCVRKRRERRFTKSPLTTNRNHSASSNTGSAAQSYNYMKQTQNGGVYEPADDENNYHLHGPTACEYENSSTRERSVLCTKLEAVSNITDEYASVISSIKRQPATERTQVAVELMDNDLYSG